MNRIQLPTRISTNVQVCLHLSAPRSSLTFDRAHNFYLDRSSSFRRSRKSTRLYGTSRSETCCPERGGTCVVWTPNFPQRSNLHRWIFEWHYRHWDETNCFECRGRGFVSLPLFFDISCPNIVFLRPTASRATHILTSMQLSASKTDKILKSKKPPSVVKPEWVTDSIKAGKRLSERQYSIITNKTVKNLSDMWKKWQ